MDGLISPEAMSIALKIKVPTCENILRAINREVKKGGIQTTNRWVRASRVAKIRDVTIEELLNAQYSIDNKKKADQQG